MTLRVQRRVWPLLIALIGLGGLVYGGWRMTQAPVEVGEEDEIPDYDDIAPGVGERWAKVQSLSVDEFKEFDGRVDAEGEVEIRAPQGMRVPVVKIHHEMGVQVKKGEPLISFFQEAIDKAIEEADAAGRTADADRFRMYSEHNPLRAPADGQVLEIRTSVGEVPFDVGIPLMTMTDPAGYTLQAWIPADIVTESVPLGLAVTVDIEDIGELKAVVVRHGATDPRDGVHVPAGNEEMVIFSLEARAGLEKDMRGLVRIRHGQAEVALVPKEAVEWVDPGHPVVRVGEEGEVRETSILIEDRTSLHRMEVDGVEREFYRVKYGVFGGQGVLVPGAAASE